MRLLICVILIFAIGKRSLAVKHFFDRDTAILRYLSGRAHFAEGFDSSLHEVVGVGRALRLSEDVSDTNAFEDGTHSTTGLYTGTMACGFEDDARAAKLSDLLVRDSAAVHGNLDKIFLGSLDTLCDGGLNFVGFTEAPAYDSVFIADYYDSGKGEGATTFGHLSDAVDGNETILEFEIVCRFYFVILICHIVLEFKTAIASGVSQ